MEEQQLVKDFRQSKFYEMVSSLHSQPLYFGMAGNLQRADFLYVSNKTGVPLLYRWDQARDTSQVLTPGGEPVYPMLGSMALHPDPSRPLAVFAKDKAGNQDFDILVVDYSKGEIRRVTRKPLGRVLYTFWASNSQWVIVGHDKETVYVRMLGEDGTLRDLYTSSQQILSACFDPERNMVGFVVGRGSEAKMALLNSSDPGKVQWAPDTGLSPFYPAAAFPDKGWVSYTVDAEDDRQELVVRSVGNLELVKRVVIPGYGSLDWVDENHLFGIILKDGRLSPRVLDLRDGSWSPPLADISGLFSTVTSKGPVWVANSLSQPPFLQALRNGKVVNLTLPAQAAKFQADSHWYPSFDGRRVQGWLLKNPDPGAPLIIYCHGGPTALQGDWWWPEIPSLVLAGFHVFAPNFRGSDGYGSEFRDLNIGDLGGGDLEDNRVAAEYASHTLGTKTKPAIVGGSYGGYLTLLALTTQPGKWAGGVAIIPPTDLEPMYSGGDAHYREWCIHFLGGTPEEKKSLYRERSPINHLEKLKVPVLLLAGENDPIVTLGPVKRFAEEARRRKLPVSLVVAKDEGHGSLQNMNAIRDTVLMLEHLKTLFGPVSPR